MTERSIYFIQCTHTKRVKIGIANDTTTRLAALQSACPTDLVLIGSMVGDTDREAALHRQFSATRLHGEWFEHSPELAMFVEALSERPPAPAPDGWLTPMMIAHDLQMSHRWAKGMIEAGTIPGERFADGWAVDPDNFAAWRHSCKVVPS